MSTTDIKRLLEKLRSFNLEDGQSVLREYLKHLDDARTQATLHETGENGEKLPDYSTLTKELKDNSLQQRAVDPSVSLKLAEHLLLMGKFIHDDSTYALGLMAKGDALSIFGHEQAAIECYNDAATLFEQAGDEVNWARSRIGWMISMGWIGHADKALLGAEQARMKLQQHKKLYQVCTIDHNTAVLYSQIGQYGQALAIYERILSVLPTITDQSEEIIQHAIALARLNQGRNYSWLGNFDRASTLLLQARQSFSTLGAWGPVSNVETSLAQMDEMRGNYGSALRRYYQVLDINTTHFQDTVGIPMSMMRIASCLVKVNREQEASALAAEAVELHKKYANSLDLGDALLEYATILSATHQFKQALTTLDEALILFEEGHLSHHSTAIKLQQAELLLKMGETEQAYRLANQLQTLFIEEGLISRVVSTNLIMAEALIKQAGKSQAQHDNLLLQQAHRLCQRIITQARESRFQEQHFKASYLLGQIAQLRGNVRAAKEHYLAAIGQIEGILKNLVLDLRPSFLRSTWTVYEALIALYLQWEQPAQAFSYLERARSLALRQFLDRPWALKEDEASEATEESESRWVQSKNAAILRLQNELKTWQTNYRAYSQQLTKLDPSVSPELSREELEREIRRCETKVNELFERLYLQQFDAEADMVAGEELIESAVDVDIAAVQSKLAPNELLLTYFLHNATLVIFAIDHEGVRTVQDTGAMSQLERLLPPLYAHLEPRGWIHPTNPPQQGIRRILQKLYQLLLAPVLDSCAEEKDTLRIVPYGPLHNLPFHALHNGKHFVIEDFRVSYLPTANVLGRFMEQGRRVRERSEVVGEKRLPLVLGYSEDGNVPRAVVEAQFLADLLQGTSYLEEEATIENFISQAEKRPLIHLATHGKLRLDAPNFSYVRLADGQLNAIDAFRLNLRECQLVTLSGCETGLALSGGGDEQLGLGRAFLAAGAAALVMSLWPVEDNATNILMQLFYQNMLAGASRIEALRAAQCTLLRQASSDVVYSHPYYWAAFHLVGATGPISL